MSLRVFHRSTAAVIVVFAIVHLANHLTSLHSIAAHIAFMDVARTLYRQPVIEFALFASVLFQCVSGLWLVARGWSARQGLVAWVQAVSGTYLALFLVIHVSAIVLGRLALHLDTNFYFAAAGFHVPPYQVFFIPYYFLAVVALFADGPTTISGLHTLRVKETDRLAALQNELTKLGADVEIEGDDTLTIHPPEDGKLKPASIDTYDDHRMAMSFSLAGTRTAGVRINDIACVNKTYPDFFKDLELLRAP